jgi:ATP-dependent DNA helicase RecQ
LATRTLNLMEDIHQILEKYWGFNTFRPLQEDIVKATISGKDTLALLPTGGGKSICFQVPALAMEGICIVISPLIALMKDQVANLKKKNIKAEAIYSGMHPKEIDIILDNCIYGNIKFLYVSPERLKTEIFKVRLQKMNVNLIAVDEAHCISQWGYDFRPPYLEIAELRNILPKVTFLALTATATPDVVDDIQFQLKFKKKHVLQKSFNRSNLAYVVFYEENKLNRLLNIAQKVPGTGVVYVRNRKKTKDVSDFLNKNGISADFYHAGLDNNTRDKKQDNWINNQTRIIVSTNAFGMGIDKPDVRFVVHIDLPDSLEAYFQEAGRAGRDEKKAYGIVLYDNNDILNLEERTTKSFPEINNIKSVYTSLGNYYQLAIGSGKGETFEFQINQFCERYKLDTLLVYNSLKFIEKEGFITLNDAVFQPSKIKFTVSHNELLKLKSAKQNDMFFIDLLLRMYAGLFEDYKKIQETDIAKKLKTDTKNVIQRLKKLDELKIISYIPRSQAPTITFIEERLAPKNFVIQKKNYDDRKKIALTKSESVIKYVQNESCRSMQLLNYFGEKNTQTCGICDVCLQRNKINLTDKKYELLSKQIIEIIKLKPIKINELIKIINIQKEEEIIKVIEWMIDNESIHWNKNKLQLTPNKKIVK